MPLNRSPHRALPARFRRQRILLIGCGDIGQRVVAYLRDRVQVLVLTSSAQRVPLLRGLGVKPLWGNLDHPATLTRLAGLAQRVLHLAPPRSGDTAPLHDQRTQALMRVLARGAAVPSAMVYGSTSGVYGDCAGAWVDETRPMRPATARAHRRASAEKTVLGFGLRSGCRVSILRIPGIYAPDRVDGMPLDRIAQRVPVLESSQDVYTNHIHAQDLARACLLALWRGKAQRRLNINDDTELRVGDYMDLAADLFGLPRPPRLSRQQMTQSLPAQRLSFLSESRRMDNRRMKHELRLKLRFPTVNSGLVSAKHS